MPRYLFLAFFAALAFFSPASWAQDDGPTAYPVKSLNAGLGPAPEDVDRETPRIAMETFLHFAEREDWAAAAHSLNLNGLDPAEQAERGPDLARKLDMVIARKAIIDWSTLLDRPDAIDAEATDRMAMAGTPRKSLLLWQLDLGRHPASIRLNRVDPPDGDPVWVFSEQTVDNIDPLYAEYGPSAFEELLPDYWREETSLGLLRWELLGLPVLVIAAIGAGMLMRRLLDFLSRWIRWRVTSDIFRAIRGPAIFGAVTAVVYVISSSLFVFSGTIDTILSPIVWIGIVTSVLWLAVNAVDVVLDHVLELGETDLTTQQQKEQRVTATRLAAGRRAFIVVAVLLGIGIFFSTTSLLRNLGWSMVGAAGALTLILGFAARRVLGNIMSSMQIALNQSAKIGDRVVYKGTLAHVERINFTYVQLRDWDGTRLVVPVEEFVTTEFENWTLQEPEMLRTVKLKLAHDVDIDVASEVFDDVMATLDPDQLDPETEHMVRVADQDVFGAEVWFCVPCSDPNSSWDVTCEAREKILAGLSKKARELDIRLFPEVTPAEAA